MGSVPIVSHGQIFDGWGLWKVARLARENRSKGNRFNVISLGYVDCVGVRKASGDTPCFSKSVQACGINGCGDSKTRRSASCTFGTDYGLVLCFDPSLLKRRELSPFENLVLAVMGVVGCESELDGKKEAGWRPARISLMIAPAWTQFSTRTVCRYARAGSIPI